MYGRAMQCDVCDQIKMIPQEHDVYLVGATAAAPGWIRLHINRPLLDNYTYRTQSRSTIEVGVDCCTIDCAQKFLREAAASSIELPKE